MKSFLKVSKISLVLLPIIFLVTACTSFTSDPNSYLTKVGIPSNPSLFSLQVNENFSPNPWSNRLALGNLDSQSWLKGEEVLKVKDLWLLQASNHGFFFYKPTSRLDEFLALINLIRADVQFGKVAFETKSNCSELCTSNLLIVAADNGKYYYLRFSDLDGTSKLSKNYWETLQKLLSAAKLQKYKSTLN